MIDEEFIKRATLMMEPLAEENRQNSIKKCKEWRTNNPDKQRACQAVCDSRRRMRKTLAKIVLTKKERKEVIEFYKNCPPGYEIDHIIPISKGGNHTIDNLQYLTKEENREKSNKWIGIDMGDHYDPNFLIKRLKNELEENDLLCQQGFNINN